MANSTFLRNAMCLAERTSSAECGINGHQMNNEQEKKSHITYSHINYKRKHPGSGSQPLHPDGR